MVFTDVGVLVFPSEEKIGLEISPLKWQKQDMNTIEASVVGTRAEVWNLRASLLACLVMRLGSSGTSEGPLPL